MPLTYTTYLNSIANLMPIEATNTAFLLDLPNIIADAEGRIYRDLDLLYEMVSDSSSILTGGSRILTLPISTATFGPTGPFEVIDGINIITPSGTSNPELGTRNAALPISKEYLDVAWPNSTGSTVPQFFAMLNQSTVLFGPWPDTAYQVEVIGSRQPAALSTTTVTTFLSVYLPDLLIAASMVRVAAYMKNFGAAVDDPKMSISWEVHYQELLKSASKQEDRKKFTAEGWSSKDPSPIVTPPRT